MKKQKSLSQALFESWLDIERKRRKLSWDELADAIGVDRSTLYRWRQKPSTLKLYELMGIVYILGIEDHDFENLCRQFGIDDERAGRRKL